MLEHTSRIHFFDKDFTFIKAKIFVFCFFFAGILLALIFDFDFFLKKSIEYAINNSASLLDDCLNSSCSFKLVLHQLYIEFFFVFITFVASHTLVPKISLACVSVAKGYQSLTIIKTVFSLNFITTIFVKIIISTYEIFLSCIFINYIISVIKSIDESVIDSNKNEFSILFSSQSRNRFFLAITACGSMILLNWLKILLLTILSSL